MLYVIYVQCSYIWVQEIHLPKGSRKKVIFLVDSPLKGGGGKRLFTKAKELFLMFFFNSFLYIFCLRGHIQILIFVY